MRTHEGVRAALLTCLLVTGMAVRSQAQFGEVQPGARVRVVAPGFVAGRADGTIIRTVRDTLWLSVDGAAPSPVPVRMVRELDVSRGRNRVAGAIRGALIGAAVGVPLGLAANPDDEGQSRSEFFFTQMVGATTIGAGIGAYIGREQWEHFELTVAQSRDATSPMRLGISYRF